MMVVVLLLHKSKDIECNNTYIADFVVGKHPLNVYVECAIM